jgi:hypothetical protein
VALKAFTTFAPGASSATRPANEPNFASMSFVASIKTLPSSGPAALRTSSTASAPTASRTTSPCAATSATESSRPPARTSCPACCHSRVSAPPTLPFPIDPIFTTDSSLSWCIAMAEGAATSSPRGSGWYPADALRTKAAAQAALAAATHNARSRPIGRAMCALQTTGDSSARWPERAGRPVEVVAASAAVILSGTVPMACAMRARRVTDARRDSSRRAPSARITQTA